MAKYSIETKQAVVRMVLEGKASIRGAARELGASQGAVSLWVRRTRQGEPLERTRGAPKGRFILGATEIASVVEWVTEDPHVTTDELRDRLVSLVGKRVSRTTLWSAMRRAGIGYEAPERAEPPAPDSLQKQTRYTQAHRSEPTEGRYPSSLTDAEWRVLRPIFEHGPRTRGRPPVHSPRIMLDAIFYVLRSGCAWRLLPSEYPKWQAVYATFRAWSRRGKLEAAYRTLHQMWRVREGRSAEPSAAIIDSQSVKTTEKGGLEATTAARRSMVESVISL